MIDPYRSLKKILFLLPPERAHDLVVSLLESTQNSFFQRFAEPSFRVHDHRLVQSVWGETFPNPVGLAAGFDKNGRIPPAVAGLGFGHVEIGGVTAKAQEGNPKPRLFRLSEDEALINRMGFNNEGADRVAQRLKLLDLPDIPLGINIGKSKVTPLEEAPDDYGYTFKTLESFGDYFVVNVSSPNTPGLRDLQEETPLTRILERLQSTGASPLLIKISPDLERDAIESIIELSNRLELDGIIATNTTTDRPETLSDENKAEEGGLSGRPLAERSTSLVKFVAERAECPVVGVGGIFTAKDAYEKILNGARLVQLYTGFVYEGPTIARNINEGLLELLEKDGFESLADAVGANLD